MDDDGYESIPNSSVAVNLAAGALAGITEHVVTYPFDALKTRMQLVNATSSSLLKNMAMAYAQGLGSLWRGVNTVVMGSGPAHALFFATYEHAKQTLSHNPAINEHAAHG